ncbi:hypothetical protein GGD81_000535 [Rhodobium orientis]|uniref:Uncharacterized protein n=1 Tax=Rhodobium orientis TaxID=34017 RepID=A0A327JH04_9HYPH|nr:hypothetical protein [Rhodobium orientis]MBB4301518.1 hypothetical protein [Rhodobium orientis]MBK5952215.1 hypothetical protein [Rhodobium orientis]RAI24574.1 hypothetical protein CH339_22000 [Rhodobium orientis]
MKKWLKWPFRVYLALVSVAVVYVALAEPPEPPPKYLLPHKEGANVPDCAGSNYVRLRLGSYSFKLPRVDVFAANPLDGRKDDELYREQVRWLCGPDAGLPIEGIAFYVRSHPDTQPEGFDYRKVQHARQYYRRNFDPHLNLVTRQFREGLFAFEFNEDPHTPDAFEKFVANWFKKHPHLIDAFRNGRPQYSTTNGFEVFYADEIAPNPSVYYFHKNYKDPSGWPFYVVCTGEYKPIHHSCSTRYNLNDEIWASLILDKPGGQTPEDFISIDKEFRGYIKRFLVSVDKPGEAADAKSGGLLKDASSRPW